MSITAGTVWDALAYHERALITDEGNFAKWISQLYARLAAEGTTNPNLDTLTSAIAHSGTVTEGSLYHVAMLILNGTSEPVKVALINLLAEEGLLSAATQANVLGG